MLSLFTAQRSLSCFASNATSGRNHICWNTAAMQSNSHKIFYLTPLESCNMRQRQKRKFKPILKTSEQTYLSIINILSQNPCQHSSIFIATESSKTLAWLRAQEPASKHDSRRQRPSVLDMGQRCFQATSCGTCSLRLGLCLANLPHQSCSQHSTLGWPNGQEGARPARKAQWDGRRETVFQFSIMSGSMLSAIKTIISRWVDKVMSWGIAWKMAGRVSPLKATRKIRPLPTWGEQQWDWRKQIWPWNTHLKATVLELKASPWQPQSSLPAFLHSIWHWPNVL